MAVEILTVSLSEDSIELLARAVARHMGDRATTQSNPPSSQNPQGAERSGFRQESRAPQNDDPWEDTPQHEQGQEQPRFCAHGEMTYFPPGYSKTKNKAYGASFRCPQTRGQNQCQAIWL